MIRGNPIAGVEQTRFEQGRAAFRASDFESAVSLLMPIAGRGRRYRKAASRYLASMYAAGVGGLPKDRPTARYWRVVAGLSWRVTLADALADLLRAPQQSGKQGGEKQGFSPPC